MTLSYINIDALRERRAIDDHKSYDKGYLLCLYPDPLTTGISEALLGKYIESDIQSKN